MQYTYTYMENLLLAGRITASVVWAIFWLTVAFIYLKNKIEFAAAISRLGKKLKLSILKITIFFIVFNYFVWLNSMTVMGYYINLSALIYAVSFIGYALLLAGLIISLKSVLKLGATLPTLEITNPDFSKNRNSLYLSFVFIAIGSALVVMNTITLLISLIFLIPFLKHRVTVENKVQV